MGWNMLAAYHKPNDLTKQRLATCHTLALTFNSSVPPTPHLIHRIEQPVVTHILPAQLCPQMNASRRV